MNDPKILKKLLKLNSILVNGNVILFVMGTGFVYFPFLILFHALENPQNYGFYGFLFISACLLNYLAGAILFIWYVYYGVQLNHTRIPFFSPVLWVGHFVYNGVHPLTFCVALIRAIVEFNPEFLFMASFLFFPAIWPFISLWVGWHIVQLEFLWKATPHTISYDYEVEVLKQEEKRANS